MALYSILTWLQTGSLYGLHMVRIFNAWILSTTYFGSFLMSLCQILEGKHVGKPIRIDN